MGRHRVVGLVLTACVVLASCSGGSERPSEPTPSSTVATAPTSTSVACDEDCSLGQIGSREGILVGAAVDAALLREDEAYAAAVARHFNSVTAENAMKWSALRTGPDEWSWDDADTIVDFAETNDMAIRGHTLVWGQTAGNGVPDWLRAISDPAEFRAAVLDGIATEVGRYRGRVDRWDVVNEPFVYTGGELDQNIYLDRMGTGYIEEAFRAAHEADPDASLWLNETAVEYVPAKADALVELVGSMVEAGVPIHGVGIQAHLMVDLPLAPDTIGSIVERLRALGVEVAITELDVPGGPNRGPDAQVALYDQTVSECLAAGCTEITVWGVTDERTWLDGSRQRETNPLLQAFSMPSNPLLLDVDYQPKATYRAVLDALIEHADA